MLICPLISLVAAAEAVVHLRGSYKLLLYNVQVIAGLRFTELESLLLYNSFPTFYCLSGFILSAECLQYDYE